MFLQVIQAYQAGVSALRLSLRDVTVERAESLVDQIQQVSCILGAVYLISSNVALEGPNVSFAVVKTVL